MRLNTALLAVSYLFLTTSLFSSPEEDQKPAELTINLKNPVFSNGATKTEEGGILSSENLRIQAKKIEYINKVERGNPVKKVIAEGDLLMEYGERAFVGDKLEYDFITHTGTLIQGRTCTDYWFLGGDEIELHADGSFLIKNAFLTTLEDQDPWWAIYASQTTVLGRTKLYAKNLKFRFFRVPIMWLPSFKMNLKWAKESRIQYKFLWEQILKQKLSMRYQLYSTDNFGLYGRLDYRFQYGPGLAVETDYHSSDGSTIFQTNSYGAIDKIVPQERGLTRYRFQGLLQDTSNDGKTTTYASYDLLSDDKMPQEFVTEDFVINTQQVTILSIAHQEKDYFGKFKFRPRINYFQSINQELPYIVSGLRPFSFGSSGVVSQNWFSAGYLDYVFLREAHGTLKSTAAGRFETNNFLYKPFSLGSVTLTPEVGAIGIFYTNNPHHSSCGQAILNYNLNIETYLHRKYSSVKHSLEPYLYFQGFTPPTSTTNNHFIFNLYDGYETLNQLKAGIRNSFYSVRHPQPQPNFSFDLYAYNFFGHTAFHRVCPKIYSDFEIRRPSFFFQAGIAYNIQETLFDYSNARADWTASENFALGVEFRHRSKYYWRKADRDNFFFDVQTPIYQAVQTPVSDGRDTLLARIQMRFSPLWTCHIQSAQGWGRRNQPSYNVASFTLSTIVTGSWQLDLSISYDPANKWTVVFPSFKLISVATALANYLPSKD